MSTCESSDMRLSLPLNARKTQVPPILTIRRAAKLLGLEEESIRRLIRRGTIPARRIPGVRQQYILYEELVAQLKPTRAGQVVL